MKGSERGITFKSTEERTFTLLKGGSFVGKIYGGRVTVNGLQPAFAFKDCGFTGVPDGISGGYVSADGGIFLYGGGCLYHKAADSSAFILAASGLARRPYFFEDGKGVTACDGAVNILIKDGEVTQTAAEKALYGGALHYERLFGADVSDGYTVRWTAAGTTDGWEEGIRNSGWLKLPAGRGKILRLVPYDDKLIAVRESGLSVIKAYGSTENFRIVNSDTDSPLITEDGIAICAGRLIFSAGEGLYAYDGSDIERLAVSGLEGCGDIICGAACGNTYFASLCLGGEKVVACVNCEDGSVSFCDFSADCLIGGGRLYAASGGALYATETAEEITYDSGYVTFGEGGRKYLKSVYIDCGQGCTLTVENGVNSRIFAGVSGKVRVNTAGNRFRFTLTAPCAVKSVAAVYEI